MSFEASSQGLKAKSKDVVPGDCVSDLVLKIGYSVELLCGCAIFPWIRIRRWVL